MFDLNVTYGFACEHYGYRNESIFSSLYQQAKVNNTSLVGVGYTQTLRPGTDMNFQLFLISFHVDFCIYVDRMLLQLQ